MCTGRSVVEKSPPPLYGLELHAAQYKAQKVDEILKILRNQLKIAEKLKEDQDG